MMKKRRFSIIALSACLLQVLFSCTNEGYDTGDGNLSYLCADFVEARTSADAVIKSVVTDEGTTLSLSRGLKPAWASVPDTVYRALLYYSKHGSPVDPLSIARVPVAVPHDQNDSLFTDPMEVESVWTSANGKYVNISLLLKTGMPDSLDQRQWVSVVYDPEAAVPSRSLLLLHSQNGVPEYYTTRMYVSVPVSFFPSQDSLCIRVNTYDGMKKYVARLSAPFVEPS